MNIFAFWEPRNKIPYYLQLCIETWKKFLPNCQITVSDMKNVGNYIDFSVLGKGGGGQALFRQILIAANC